MAILFTQEEFVLDGVTMNGKPVVLKATVCARVDRPGNACYGCAFTDKCHTDDRCQTWDGFGMSPVPLVNVEVVV